MGYLFLRTGVFNSMNYWKKENEINRLKAQIKALVDERINGSTFKNIQTSNDIKSNYSTNCLSTDEAKSSSKRTERSHYRTV